MISLEKSAHVGDVTAVHLISLGPGCKLVLAGCGPHVLVYNLHGGKQLAVCRVVSGSRIHGITTCLCDDSPFTPCCTAWVVVYGDRWVHVLQLELLIQSDRISGPAASRQGAVNGAGPTSAAAAAVVLTPALTLPARPGWVLTAHLQQMPLAPNKLARGEAAGRCRDGAVSCGMTEGNEARVAAAEGTEASVTATLLTAAQPPSPRPFRHRPVLLMVLVLADNSAEMWALQTPEHVSGPHVGAALAAGPAAVTAGLQRPVQLGIFGRASSGSAITNTAVVTTAAPPRAGPPLLEARWLVAAQCSRRMQLLSAAVLPVPLSEERRGSEVRLWLATGTMLNEILLWRLPLLPAVPVETGQPASGTPPGLAARQSGAGCRAQALSPGITSAGQPGPAAPDAAAAELLGAATVAAAESAAAVKISHRDGGAAEWPYCIPAAHDWVLTLAAWYEALERRLTRLELRCGLGGSAACNRTRAEGAAAWTAAGLAAGNQRAGWQVGSGAVSGGPACPRPAPLRVECPPQYVLRGHEGSVFHVAWLRADPASLECGSAKSLSDGWLLVTASDDRSARLWALPDLMRPIRFGSPPTALAPLRTFWGHTSRVWCCAAVSGAMPAASAPAAIAAVAKDGSGCGNGDGVSRAVPLSLVLVTGAEDCTARLWHAATGKCLAVLQGHRGRGIWCCALIGGARGGGSGGNGEVTGDWVLATAGADSAIRLWDLREWLPLAQDEVAAGRPGLRDARPGASGGLSLQTVRLPQSQPAPLNPAALLPRSAAPAGAAADGARCLALAGGGDLLLAATYSGGLLLLDLMGSDNGGWQQRRLQQHEATFREGEDVGADQGRQQQQQQAGPTPPPPWDGGNAHEHGGCRGGGGDRWVRLYDNPCQGAVTCLEVCPIPQPAAPGSTAASSAHGLAHDVGLLAVGHNAGVVAVLRVCRTGDGDSRSSSSAGGDGAAEMQAGAVQATAVKAAARGARVDVVCSWRATDTGAVIAAWWVGALGQGVLLTAAGDTPAIKLWRLADMPGTSSAPLPQVPGAAAASPAGPVLVAVARSPLRGRLLVADVCAAHRVMFAGDQYGNLVAFWLPTDVWALLAGALSTSAPSTAPGLASAAASGQMAPSSSPAASPSPGQQQEQQLLLPCVAVFRSALGSAAASMVRLQQPDTAGVFLAAGRDGVIATYRCVTNAVGNDGDGTGDGAIDGAVGGSVVDTGDTGAATAGSVATPAPGGGRRPHCRGGDVCYESGGRGISGLPPGDPRWPVRLECLGTQSRTGVTSIELAVAWQPQQPPRRQTNLPLAGTPPQQPDAKAPHMCASSADGAAAGVGQGAFVSGSCFGGGDGSAGGGGCNRDLLVAGFRAADFIAVMLAPDAAEVMRVPACGGWRRTHALHVNARGGGGEDGVGITFAYIDSSSSSSSSDGGTEGSVIRVLRRGGRHSPPPTPAIGPDAAAPDAPGANGQAVRGGGAEGGLPLQGRDGAAVGVGSGAPAQARAPATGRDRRPGLRVHADGGGHGVPALPRSLHVGHHGREVLCVCVLPAWTGLLPQSHRHGGPHPLPQHSPPALCVLTGAEDGSIRRVTACAAAVTPCSVGQANSGGTNGSGGGGFGSNGGVSLRQYELCFRDGAIVGEHAAGTAVRCLAACQLGSQEAALLGAAPPIGPAGPDAHVARRLPPYTPYLVVSAGAKEVLMAWLVCVQASASGSEKVSAPAPAGNATGIMTGSKVSTSSCAGAPQLQPAVQHGSADREVLAEAVEGVTGNDANDAGGAAVSSRWLSTRMHSQAQPQGPGERPRSLLVSQSQPRALADRRYLALALLGVATAPRSTRGSTTCSSSGGSNSGPQTTSTTALLAVSSSDATASLLTWELSSRRAWTQVARLELGLGPKPGGGGEEGAHRHPHPVLAMAHTTHSVAVSSHGGRGGAACAGAGAKWPPGLAGDDIAATAADGGQRLWDKISTGSPLERQASDEDSGMDWVANVEGGGGSGGGGGGSGGCSSGSGRNMASPDEGHGSGYWLATGDNAGSVALWWIPRWLHSAGSGSAAGTVGGVRGSGDESRQCVPLHPVLTVHGVHQAGVNALAVVRPSPPLPSGPAPVVTPPPWAGCGASLSPAVGTQGPGAAAGAAAALTAPAVDETRLVVISGGDDQALAVLHVRLRRQSAKQSTAWGPGGAQQRHLSREQVPNPAPEQALDQDPKQARSYAVGEQPPQWEAVLVGAAIRPLAHASALRGVAITASSDTAPCLLGTGVSPQMPLVSSVGLDQVVRLWQLRRCTAVGSAYSVVAPGSPQRDPMQAASAAALPTSAATTNGTATVTAAAGDAEVTCPQHGLHVKVLETAGGSVALKLTRGLTTPVAQCGDSPHCFPLLTIGQALAVDSESVSSRQSGGGGSAKAGSCLVGGEEPLAPEPVAASRTEVPEPACVATLQVAPSVLEAPMEQESRLPHSDRVPLHGYDDRFGAEVAVADAVRNGLGPFGEHRSVSTSEDGVGGLRVRLVAAVAGRGLQLLEGVW